MLVDGSDPPFSTGLQLMFATRTWPNTLPVAFIQRCAIPNLKCAWVKLPTLGQVLLEQTITITTHTLRAWSPHVTPRRATYLGTYQHPPTGVSW